MISIKNKKSKKVSQSFAAGAFIMAIGMLIVKIAGAAFKIPLTYILKGTGLGYFNSAYNIYNPIYALATAGLPIAISRVVSSNMAQKRYKDVRMIHKLSIPIFVFTGITGCLLMILGSFVYINYTYAPGTIYSMFALAPTVIFACLISIYKGYYEGLRNMIPTAVSEIVEAVCKVIFGPTLASLAINYCMDEYNKFGTVLGNFYNSEAEAYSASLPLASAGAILGITLAAFCGFLYIFIKYKISGDGITDEEFENAEPARDNKTLIKSILKISIPIALGAILMNLAGAIDTMLVQRRLYDLMNLVPDIILNMYKGLIPVEEISNGKTHVFLSGCFVYMNNITMLLPTITQGLAISALPNVTTAWVGNIKEKIKNNIETVLKVTTVISFPAGIGMSILSYPIMDFVYNTFGKTSQAGGEIYIASKIMVIYAIGIIFVSISTPICSMLQAVGRADLHLKILTIGMIIKVALNYILVSVPEINIQGAGMGTLFCYLFICISGIILLSRETKLRFDYISIFLKPLSCGIICGLVAFS
ncbi:MAG: polysaccharide biosynthesis protein, partial [Clostridia bacterium]|nr:polysaccharide biosynthesis protein [Clostridia bacterium]